MVITVIGLGFVGLTAAIGFASKGHRVYGIEKNRERREQILSGKLPFYEPGMQEYLEKTLGNHLFLQENQQEAAEQSDCIFYCVGTPIGENGRADLSYLTAAIRETLELLPKQSGTTLVVKSTVPPGTLRDVAAPLALEMDRIPGEDIELANNPEFLREGKCWEDFMQADRLVIGAMSDRAFSQTAKVYEDFSAPIERVTTTTAEFIKYLSNTLLATMISYSNEMANAADQIGDVEIGRAFRILHQDRRWESNTMSSYVYPGCGYGGYCLPKDTQAMYYAGTRAGAEMPLLRAVTSINQSLPEKLCDRLLRGSSQGEKIGVLGLAFKPFTDDVRDTPAARLIACLRKRGYTEIYAYDPLAEAEFQKYYPELEVRCLADPEEMIKICDRLAIMTAWPEFARCSDSEKVWDFRYLSKEESPC